MTQQHKQSPAQMTSELHLRPFVEKDAQWLLNFYNGLSEEFRRLFRPLGWTATAEQCAEIVRQSVAGERWDMIAEIDGRFVGWVFLTRTAEEKPHLGIGCADDYTGRGLGAQLMSAAVSWARDREKGAIDLIVVQDNVRAQRLYQRYGFRITGESTGTDGLDYYHMELEL